jgi:hypothetical protein
MKAVPAYVGNVTLPRDAAIIGHEPWQPMLITVNTKRIVRFMQSHCFVVRLVVFRWERKRCF